MMDCLFRRSPVFLASLLLPVMVFSLLSADHSLALFQYVAPLHVPSVTEPRIAELHLTADLYEVLRDDFADLRVVRGSDNGVVPAGVLRRTADKEDLLSLVRRPFSVADHVPDDLVQRYAESAFLSILTDRVPLTGVELVPDKAVGSFSYLLLGRVGVHKLGGEWKLLARETVGYGEAADTSARILSVSFPESRCSQYVFIFSGVDSATRFSVKSVHGPDYYARFVIRPGESYMLLCGYPDAPSVAGYGPSATVKNLPGDDGMPVQVSAGGLLLNEQWRGETLRKYAFRRSFLIPLSVAGGVFVLLLFLFAFYSVVYRRNTAASSSQPYFFR